MSSVQRVAIVFATVVGVYAFAATGDFLYDDLIVVKQERVAAGPADFAQIFAEPHYPFRPYYRPVTRATFLLQKTLQGDLDPGPWHLVNALLAGLAAVLAFGILRAPALGVGVGPALLGALAFGLHPLTSSTVYPIASGRETLLPNVLLLAALLAFLRGGRAGYRGSLVLTAAALFAKEHAVVLPVIFVLADALGLTGARPPAAAAWVRRYAPFALLEAAYFAVRWRLFEGAGLEVGGDPRLILGAPVYALQQALLPTWALVYEPTEIARWLSGVRWALIVGGAVAAGWGLRSAPKPARAVLLFWLGFFLTTLAPTANLVAQDAPFSERYAALPLLAVVGLLCSVVSECAAQTDRRVVLAIGALTCAPLAVVTVHRAVYFADNVTFTTQWSETSPDYYLAHYNHGRALELAEQLEAAESSYRRSLALDDAWAPAHLNLGGLLLRRGDLENALTHFSVYSVLEPRSAKGPYHVGLVYLQLDRFDEAIAAYEQALRLDPTLAQAHNNLGVIHAIRGNLERSVEHYQRALALQPDRPGTRENLERVLAELEAGRGGG